MHEVPAVEEREEERKPSLVAPAPPRVGNPDLHREPPTLIWKDLGGHGKSGRLRLHTHTASSMSITAAPTGRAQERNSSS